MKTGAGAYAQPLKVVRQQRGMLAQPPARARVVLVQLVQARGALHLGGRVDTHLGHAVTGRAVHRGRGEPAYLVRVRG